MPCVYFTRIGEGAEVSAVSAAARTLLETIVAKENIPLENHIPLKVHFGERGNSTFLKPETYSGIIDFLQERSIRTEFMETSVLYGGERFNRERHAKLALSHGFTRLPVVIADGANGEEAVDIPLNFKHFRSASIARQLAESKQVIVLSHFKGHMLAGFGGAIKQLSMGFAAKGGKMAMHMSVKPTIFNLLCRKCGLCRRRCNTGAITIGKRSVIDHKKCIGCGACFSICPHHAVSIFSLSGFWNAMFKRENFREKLVEYAYASHAGRRNIYLSFALSITKGCDCEPRPMFRYASDIGIFASTDPVAIDSACLDALAKQGKHFKGAAQLDYAEKIGLGSRKYTLIEI